MKFYISLLLLNVLLFENKSFAQVCAGVDVTCVTYESRCSATGAVKINASGGSGNFSYKVTGAVSTSYTTSDSITGLSAGTYTVYIRDNAVNCTSAIANVVVDGNYADPRFLLTGTDVTCIHGTNGTISAIDQQFGRGPFSYAIISPSASHVGDVSVTGTFTGLSAGDYLIQLSDSCGGLQTRSITLLDYDWWINSHTEIKTNCNELGVTVNLIDNKGNTNASGTVFNGYLYGVTTTAGDTTWYSTKTFTDTIGSARSADIVVKDLCGNTKKVSWIDTSIPSVANAVLQVATGCNEVTASITGQQNLTTPYYCLYDSSGTLLTCDSTGVFSGLTYGSYCIRIQNSCYDTLIERCFTVGPVIPNGGVVAYSNISCNSFTATITGGTNLINAQYCLYDSLSNLITCNSTGIFDNLNFGSYCINITDGCYDTTIVRCFSFNHPVPVIGNTNTSNFSCAGFTLSVDSSSNVFNPQYCLYDSTGALITCNNTGVFDTLTYGSYCIHLTDSCSDTTVIKCITVSRPTPGISGIKTSAMGCAGFSATVQGQQNFFNPLYCLYDSSGAIIICNTTGVFDTLSYGAYCIHITDSCFDSTIVQCFSLYKPVTSLSGSVKISNKNCSTFTASLQGQGQNLTSPQYCLYSDTTLITCNYTGVFDSLAYGSYCIHVKDSCYDTTIIKCFSVNPSPASISVNANPSCVLGKTDLSVLFNGGTTSPYYVYVYNPSGVLVASDTSNSTNIHLRYLIPLDSGLKYEVIGVNGCGSKDTVFVKPDISYFTRTISTQAKCPGALFPNGSTDATLIISTNFNGPVPKIIKKNGSTANIVYTTHTHTSAADTYNFLQLEPATYIFSTVDDNCGLIRYDTVNVSPYTYPALQKSAAYQCDNNAFSVGTSVTGGVSPMMYEIIQSTPATPSIVSPPQSSPIFTINNGNIYSLVRLRVTDACGNASLNDASVLPLAVMTIDVSTDCLYGASVLSVDSSMANATYSWYRKTSVTDSILISTSPSYFLDSVMPSDTGQYVCRVSVNKGCLTRLAYYNLTGNCIVALPGQVQMNLSASAQKNGAALLWNVSNDQNVIKYIVEKSQTKNGVFISIGEVSTTGTYKAGKYNYTDYLFNNTSYYRIKAVTANGKIVYSNIFQLNGVFSDLQIFPNPATDGFVIKVKDSKNQLYTIALYNLYGQIISHSTQTISGNIIRIKRPANLAPATYIVSLYNHQEGQRITGAVILK
ncbi:MAG: T9SS type A sorting domain-containing protein [Sphingobacteriales bacterium]|nr:T9SS type A sorting domain-containing protein [Sphingobacteriales bacterium]MBI3720142.1 T9SS type A sorting domain-containing protein [Sphingobacteriales bacterium]